MATAYPAARNLCAAVTLVHVFEYCSSIYPH
jgi:hypothetical protein